jgi:glycosyltransferase involved in cell wall biosynthesis
VPGDALRELARPLARSARHVGAHVRGLRAMVAGRPPRGEPAVWYGMSQIPDARQTAVGGIVKLQHLVERFPNRPRRFNVLYLVSSRLPDAPEALAWWAKRTGARLVVNQNGVAYPAWHGPGWERVNQPMTALLAAADHVFYQSEFCRVSADRFAGPATAPSEILYNAVDVSRFRPSPRVADKRVVLLLGGSQDQWYRFDAAVRTLAVLRRRHVDAELIVTGRLRWSPDERVCKREAEARVGSLRLSDRITLTGPYTQAEAPALFQRADILLHTKYNDPCPTVVIEALASGLPVVYSRSGGVPELVGEHAGAGVAADLSWERDLPPEPEALAGAVDRVRDRLHEHRQAARQRAVDRFDVRRWVDRHAEVFGRLAS